MSTKYTSGQTLIFRVVVTLAMVLPLALSFQPAAAAPMAVSVGACAMVANSNSAGGLAVRSGPSTSASILKRISDGTQVTITGGPVSANGYTWWNHNQGGWSAGSYLVDCPAPAAYNSAFLTDAQMRDSNSMSVATIRSFLVSHGSYFRQPVPDVDGVSIDLPQLIYNAAQKYRISPKVLLATLEKENTGVSRGARPANVYLKTLFGCGTSTARDQVACAAATFNSAMTALEGGRTTISGWKKGVAKMTQDGVKVTPATNAVAAQFTYTPYAGAQWGGNQRSVGGVYLFFRFWNDFGFNR